MDLCLHDYFHFQAAMRPATLFAKDSHETLTYGEAKLQTDRIAAALQLAGLSAGDRVGILAKNSVRQLLLFLACAKLGVIPVGLNYRLAPAELQFVATDAELKWLFAEAEFMTQLNGLNIDCTLCQLDGSSDELLSFDTWLEQLPAGSHADLPTLHGSNLLFQMYTSGTTGRPKGALLSHANILSNVQQVPLTTGIPPVAGDKSLVIAPLYHAAGLLGALAAVVYGCSLVIHSDYDPVGMIQTLVDEKIAGVTVVPVMLQFSIACVPNIREMDFSALKMITYGASPISAELLAECVDIFQCDFGQGYGQTESSAVLTCLSPDDHRKAVQGQPELLRSCGRAVFATDIKIIDPQGNELPAGEVGEIIARGPQVMQGYWNRPEASAKTLADGWLHTGDAAKMDEEGYVYIQDRIKDLVISGGENIYPAEVENVLMSHPDIQDAAVIGVKDDKWGEVPLAVLVGEKALKADELASFCRDRLASFKIPKYVEYLEVLPRNPTGKLLKRELRERFQPAYES